MVDKNVIIPLTLLLRIVDLLGYWDVSKYDIVIRLEHCDIIKALNNKKRRLELRDDYAKIIHAKNVDARDDARIWYLQQKSWLRDDEGGVPF
jgi:hypothetical protein